MIADEMLRVDVEGEVRKPWVTWFVDAASNAGGGTAVTPGVPSREAVVAALRASIIGARRTAEELGRVFTDVPIRTSGRDGVLAEVAAARRWRRR